MNFPTTLPQSRLGDPMQAPAIRWGLLGTGWIAQQFVRSATAHTQQIFSAVGSRNLDSARRFADAEGVPRAHGSYEDLVNDPDVDVIYVATPHNFHHEHVLLALNAGKHVLVEKPMGLNHAQASEMVSLARDKGLFFAEALWSYFLPKFDVIAQLLDDGVLGEISATYTDFGEYLPPDHRLFDARLAGGPLLDLGTYPVSLITRMMGAPDDIAGFGIDDPAGVNGQIALAMRHKTGLSTLGTTPYGFTPTNAAVVGRQATLRFTTEVYLPGGFSLHNQANDSVLTYEERTGRHFEGLFWEAAEVARCISKGQTETACRPLDESLMGMATLDHIRRVLGIDFAQAGLVE
ncbi:Gfo/Idh/MocA family oxidoreductase [Thioclava sp. DLFJ4-1]|uniref:Gfo/Idh/MocA family protein n=1 Tax=Thioclava sp. DLFJ4-1 TaxID=1915313 RepID=UPI0009978159|nr:Gfo/Idh/MocA family oxidoreductase [Thioclava sp. DLFJ4-1]OOY14490.1 hypothetical protein BMI85_20515 [Thioclava sp. DLFJ4-1]